jgi:hypothetical protein
MKLTLCEANTARFWRYVRKADGCWLWAGRIKNGRGSAGYGEVYCSVAKKYVSVHRYSYLLAHGHLPEGLHICHHCDVRNCVNPAHLYAGTAADTMRDRSVRGRGFTPASRSGAENHKSLLTPERVRLIRRIHAMGVSQVALATLCGVHRTTIRGVITGRVWAHVE